MSFERYFNQGDQDPSIIQKPVFLCPGHYPGHFQHQLCFWLYLGLSLKAKEYGLTIAEIETGQIIMTIVVGLFFLILITGGLFLLFRWGFRRLYGNYLLKLRLTLKELTEIEEP